MPAPHDVTLTDRDWQVLAAGASAEKVVAGAVIIAANVPNRFLYRITKGSAKDQEGACRADWVRICDALLGVSVGAGTLLGLEALLGRPEYTTSSTAAVAGDDGAEVI